MGDQATSDFVGDLRAELVGLAEKGEIKYSVVKIKKANREVLGKIRAEYDRKQLEETNEYLSDVIMEKFSEFMKGLDMIDDAKSMEEDLSRNKMVRNDLRNVLGYVTPFIPLIGLVCGITIVGKHVYNRTDSNSNINKSEDDASRTDGRGDRESDLRVGESDYVHER